MRVTRISNSFWFRPFAIFTAFMMTVTACASGLQAISQSISSALISKGPISEPNKTNGEYPTMKIHEAVPWNPSMAGEEKPQDPATLLDGNGKLRNTVTLEQVENWKRELQGSVLGFKDREWRRLWIAECELALKEEPDAATALFDKLIAELPSKNVVRSYALLGRGFSLFRAGRYKRAGHELSELVRRTPIGLNRKIVQSLAKHAKACANYHEERRKAGITEPERIDPLCGASSLAYILKDLDLPCDEKSVASNVRHTGFGSNMQDLIDAAAKYGLVAKVFTADSEGMRLLLKLSENPLVVRVEKDHFINVLSANEAGVTYACSDCGPWPGGTRRLNWKQWKMMDADGFLAVARPETDFGKALKLLSLPNDAAQILAEMGQVSILPEAIADPIEILAKLRDANLNLFLLPLLLNCGIPPEALQCICVDGVMTCATVIRQPSAMMATATADPVNLATGAEVYHPKPVLNVYNPIGPSVTWSHSYSSMAVPIPNGYGVGWYHPYLWTLKLKVGGVPDPPIGGPPPNPTTTGGTTGSTGGSESFGGGAESFGGGGSGPDSEGYVIVPNSGTLDFEFDTDEAPTSTNPSYIGTMEAGAPYAIEWKYDSGAPGSAVVKLTNKNRDVMTFKQLGTLPNPNTQRYYYLSRITDRNGRYIDLEWAGPYQFKSHNLFTNSDTGFALSTIKDDQGSALLTLGYGSSWGRIVSATDRYGRSVYYTVENFANENIPSWPPEIHDDLDELTQVSTVWTGGGSPTVGYEYEYENQTNWEAYETVPYLKTISVPSPTGSGMSTATIHYDSYGYVWQTVDANGNKNFYEPIGFATSTKVTTKNSSNQTVNEFTVGYNANMSLAWVKNADDEEVYSLTYTDPSTPHRPSAIEDGNARIWSLTWDQFNNLETVTTPKEITTEYTWDYSEFPLGELVEVQEGTKTSTTITYYEPSGLVETINTPIPGQSGTTNRQTTEFTYDSLGNVLTVESPGNNATSTKTTTFNYTTDGTYSQSAKMGQPVLITDPLGKGHHYRYNSQGLVTSSWDPLGNIYESSYNLANQVTDSYAPATGQTGTGSARSQSIYLYAGGPAYQFKAYEEDGDLVRSVTLALGAEGELLSRTGSTEDVYLTYDAAYRTKTLKDGNEKTTTYAYNDNGQVSSVTFPLATGANFDKIQFTDYDPVGNLLTRVDGRNITTTYEYDDVDGLLTNVNYSGYSSQNVTIEYDDYDRATTITDGSGTSTAEFDDLDNLLESTRTYTSVAAKTFEYAYYPDGSREELSTPFGDWNYLYNANGWCTSSTSPAGATSYQYEDNGWLKKRTLPNSTYTDYLYEENGALRSLVNKTSGNTTLSSFGTFVYDGVFNLKNVTSSVPAQTSYQGTQTWVYDTKDRLTSEAGTRLSGYTHSFGYDSAGNPTTFKGATRTFNDDNQRTATGYAYDGNGNPTTYNSSTLTFDVENRMTALGSHAYGYRSDGLRAWKQASSASAKTYFLYDGGNAIVEMDPSGAATAINDFAPDGLSGRKVGSTWQYYVFDQQGNVAERLSSSEAVSSHSVYDAYGVKTVTGSPSDPFGYNGQSGYYLDRESGYYLCQLRYFDPDNGRFITRDPIGYSGAINLFGYCASNPVGLVDPSGLMSAATPHGKLAVLQLLAEIDGAVLKPAMIAGGGALASILNNPRVQQGLVSIAPRCSSILPRFGERANQFGMRAHNFYSQGVDGIVNRSPYHGSNVRPDIINHSTRTIIEIKPWTSLQEAIAQATKYAEMLDKKFPGTPWKVEIWPYWSPWTGPLRAFVRP